MERINKARSTRRIIDDKSSLVKAAAWAWYEHGSSGSSNESRHTVQEYDGVSSRKTKIAPRPSRYKLEAMNQQAQQKNEMFQKSCLVHGQDDPNSLLDSYEIGRIATDLDCYIEASHARYCQNLCCRHKMLSSGASSITHDRRKTYSYHVSCKNKGKGLSQEGGNSSESEIMKTKQKDRKSPKRIGFKIGRSTVICGARLDDVVDVSLKTGGSRWHEKQPAVVSMSTCRPATACVVDISNWTRPT